MSYLFFVTDITGKTYGSRIDPATQTFYKPRTGVCENCAGPVDRMLFMFTDKPGNYPDIRCGVKGADCFLR